MSIEKMTDKLLNFDRTTISNNISEKKKKKFTVWPFLIIIAIIALVIIILRRETCTPLQGHTCGPHTKLIDDQCVGEDAAAAAKQAKTAAEQNIDALIAAKAIAEQNRDAAVVERAAAYLEKVTAENARDVCLYKPCAGKENGDSCLHCAPGDANCAETMIVKRCQSGICQVATSS